MKKFEIVKNIIQTKDNDNIFKHFLNVCRHLSPKFFKKKKFINFSDESLCETLIDLKKNNREVFSNIYKTMQISNEILKIAYINKVQKIAGNFLKFPIKNFSTRNAQFRMDLPFDKENSYGWHQDNAYYNYNVSAKNGVVLWIPLVNTNKSNGTLIIKPDSYNCDTSASSKKIKKKNKFSSDQILVKENILKKFKYEKSVNINKNNALVTTAGIFHRSGINTSKVCRFVLVVRFNNIFSKDFIYKRQS